MPRNTWTNHEIERLDTLYGTKPLKQILTEFPNRSQRAIESMAARRGLGKKYIKKSRTPRVNRYLAFAKTYKSTLVF